MISFTSLQSLLSQQSPNTQKINSVPDRYFKEVSSAMAAACKTLISAPPHRNENAILGAHKPSAQSNLVLKLIVKMVRLLPMIGSRLSPLGFRLKERRGAEQAGSPTSDPKCPLNTTCVEMGLSHLYWFSLNQFM